MQWPVPLPMQFGHSISPCQLHVSQSIRLASQELSTQQVISMNTVSHPRPYLPGVEIKSTFLLVCCWFGAMSIKV
jgi:hypothetical protein